METRNSKFAYRAIFVFTFAFLLSIFAPSSRAQGGFTTVTGTITGPIDGIVWSCGTISAQLITAGGAAPTLNGVGFTTSTSPIALGCPTTNGLPAGSFSMRLADSGVIVPSNTTWKFTVNMAPGIAPPAGTGPQSFTFTTAINCSTNTPSTCTANAMDISAQLSALAPKLSNASGGTGTGFPVTTAVAVNSGGSITVNSGGSIGAAGTGTITATNGVGGATNSGAPAMGFYFTNQCTTSNTGQCYYTFSDTQQATDCGWTNASTTVTCTGSHFLPTDCVGGSGCTGVGTSKNVMGGQTCAADQSKTTMDTGVISTTTNVTIATYISGTQITLSATPANTATISTTYPTGGCFIWGHLDDTNAATLDTALQSSTVCPKLFMAAVGYFFNTPHFYTNPASCAAIAPGIEGTGGGGFGNTSLPAGFEIEGRGTGNTAWYLSPAFPGGDACNHTGGGSAANAAHAGGCFAITSMGKWMDFRIDGGTQGEAPSLTSNHTLVFSSLANIRNFLCVNYGGYSSLSTVGLDLALLNQLDTVNIAGCSNIQIWLETGTITGTNFGMRVISENAGTLPLYIAGPSGSSYPKQGPALICYGCIFVNSQQATGISNFAILNDGGYLSLIGGRVADTNTSSQTQNGMTGYSCRTAGCILYAENVTFEQGLFGAAGNTNSSISDTAAGTEKLLNVSLTSQSSGFDLKNVAGGSIFDLGGNTFTPRASLGGSVYGSASITGVQLVTGNVVLTSGWGTGAAASAFSGSSTSESWTTTIGTAPSTTSVTTVTFPAPFLPTSTVTCSATLGGGTSTAILQAQCVATPTTATITYLGTLVSGTVITRLTASN